MTIYMPESPRGWYDGAPPILAVGDSWFWYPENNILEALESVLPSEYANIQLEGYNGALLQEYVGAGKYAAEVASNLTFANRMGFNVFLISGAGNDAVNYKLALKNDCSGIADPADCFDAEGLSELLKTVSSALGALIHEIRWAYQDLPPQDRPIFIHGYDYPIPDGRPFSLTGLGVVGPWLKPAMDPCHVSEDMDFRKAVMRYLIDQLNALFGTFAATCPEVIYIDSRGTLDDGPNYQTDWANELHPTPQGFNKIVNQHWVPALRSVGIIP